MIKMREKEWEKTFESVNVKTVPIDVTKDSNSRIATTA